MPVVSYLPTEILDYIHTHAPAEEASFGIDQREISKALGYHPCSMSRPLAELVRGGLLLEKRSQVRGGLRKHLVYALTDAGRQRIEKQTTDAPFLSSAIPPAPNPFLGRTGEIRKLMAFARAGGGLVTLKGQAGMGKTSLAARFLRRVKIPETVPFWFTVREASSARHFTQALAHTLSPLGAQQLAYYAQLPREPIGREVADLVHRALGNRSLVGVIDDLHVAGPELHTFLVSFAESQVRGRADTILLSGHVVPENLSAEVRSLDLEVAGIDRAAAHELTDRKGGLAERFEDVYSVTKGNPLLLQLAMAVPGEIPSATSLPAAVVSKLRMEDVLGLLPVALSNEPLPVSFLIQGGELTAGQIHTLTNRGMLHTAAPGFVEVFQVLRPAFLGRVDRSQVRAAHMELARYYARSHRPESIRERFLHFTAAGAYGRASEILSRQETGLLASGYSVALRLALQELADSASQSVLRVRALRTLSSLQRIRSEYLEALQSLRKAAVAAGDDGRLRAECVLSTIDLHCRLHALVDAEEALREARALPLSTKRLQLLEQLSRARIEEEKGNLAEARADYSELFTQAKRTHHADLALEALARWSRVASVGGTQAARTKLVEEGIIEARNSGRVDILFALMSHRARTYIEDHDLAAAEADLIIIRKECEALGYLSQLVYTLSGFVALCAEKGRWSEMDSYAKETIEIAGRLGNDLVVGHTLALQCNARLRQQDFVGAIAVGEQSVAVLERLPLSESLLIAHGSLADAYVEGGRTGEGRDHYETALSLADRLGMGSWRSVLASEVGRKFEDLAPGRAALPPGTTPDPESQVGGEEPSPPP
ncbi:MAG: hypothetical protein L3K11_08145 [Thermoplasmata archaeon]|nr:hypothetical protein [Thermoplasmata archaeon]